MGLHHPSQDVRLGALGRDLDDVLKVHVVPRRLGLHRGGLKVRDQSEEVHLNRNRGEALLPLHLLHQHETLQAEHERHGAVASGSASGRVATGRALELDGRAICICAGRLQADRLGLRDVAELNRHGDRARRLQPQVLQRQLMLHAVGDAELSERHARPAQHGLRVLLVLVEHCECERRLLEVLAEVRRVHVHREAEGLLEPRVAPLSRRRRLLLAELEKLEVHVGGGAQPVGS
mmetsp:Transcript_19271/g.45686  ORF Transcript_19271/g.45686 Transcript_19271/m.45686 type:complete len:234 (-) Transcript_19271:34-735(-)|eukprot:scaffold57714_cov66-Phaeocystis_antarctica.AAC.3